MIKNNIYKIAILWLAPLLVGPLYGLSRYLLHFIFPHVVGVPDIRTVISVALLESLSSPLWVGVGFLFTYFFGGIVIVLVIRGLAKNKFLRRRFVISTKRDKDTSDFETRSPGERISRISSAPLSILSALTKKNFSLCLALTLSVNLVYTLTIQRYFQDLVFLPKEAPAQLYRYLLSSRLIVVDYSLALLFLPILAIIVPLFLGKISVRQIDSQRLDLYWLSYVYSIAGGASLILFLVDAFEVKSSTELFVVAIVLVYGILSWYTAIGITLALPHAERQLARELVNLQNSLEKGRGTKGGKQGDSPYIELSERNIIFGKLYAGPTKDDTEEV